MLAYSFAQGVVLSGISYSARRGEPFLSHSSARRQDTVTVMCVARASDRGDIEVLDSSAQVELLPRHFVLNYGEISRHFPPENSVASSRIDTDSEFPGSCTIFP